MAQAAKVFHIFLVKPTHYDKYGYPIQWFRSIIPSNSLACVYGLTLDCIERKILGDDVDVKITLVDEVNQRVRPDKLIAKARRDGAPAALFLIGVQSNQFPRSMDIAEPFLDAGIPVCVGGFHVSGCISMLSQMPEDLREAQEKGVSFFLGEAEGGRLDDVLKDAYAGAFKPVYDHLANLPNMEETPIPFVPKDVAKRAIIDISSFDLGRGCPFQCSFCSIINVHGRQSRFRTADDLEAIVRRNVEMGINYFFVTDDNLARNKNWEVAFDRLIKLREEEGIKIEMVIQVDTMCHKIPGFIDKAVRAGAAHIFIGLENINPANLIAAKKLQNRITEYREMFLAWKKHPVFITCGYIVGFPFDTPETVVRDVEIIKNELPLDAIYFTYLTPLPGSEDHKNLYEAGEFLDPDMNKYDLHQRVSHHPVMSDEEWEAAVDAAWEAYYTPEHMKTVLKRVFGTGSNRRVFTAERMVWHYYFAKGPFNHYKMEGGFIPLRFRKDRRPTFKREHPLVFYPRYAYDLVRMVGGYMKVWGWFRWELQKLRRNPEAKNYRDAAIAPVVADEIETSRLLTETTGGAESVAREKKKFDIIANAKRRAAKSVDAAAV
ncbi:MAG: radical SAM protein [Pseudomonadota bacterium]